MAAGFHPFATVGDQITDTGGVGRNYHNINTADRFLRGRDRAEGDAQLFAHPCGKALAIRLSGAKDFAGFNRSDGAHGLQICRRFQARANHAYGPGLGWGHIFGGHASRCAGARRGQIGSVHERQESSVLFIVDRNEIAHAVLDRAVKHLVAHQAAVPHHRRHDAKKTRSRGQIQTRGKFDRIPGFFEQALLDAVDLGLDVRGLFYVSVCQE